MATRGASTPPSSSSDNLEEGDKVVALRILAGVDVLETRWAAAEKIFEENGIEAEDFFTGADPTEIKKIITDALNQGEVAGVWMDAGDGAVAAIEAFEDAGVDYPVMTGEDTHNDDPLRSIPRDELGVEKLLPPKIQQTDPADRRQVPEGLWVKCPSCETVLYKTDLEQNQNVCPTCSHHHRMGARARLNGFLDAEGRYELGQEVLPVDALKFKDSRRYPERLKEALENTGETDALVVMGGAVHSISLVAAAFEFDFMGGSMGSVVGERFVRGVEAAVEQKVPFLCFTATGGARMQEGLLSLMQMAKTNAMR